MSEKPSDELRDLLLPGEEIRWYGGPENQRRVRAVIYVFLLLLGFPLWVSLAIFGGLSYPISGITALAAIGVLAFLARRMLKVRSEGREYAVTNRRVVKSGGWLNKTFETLPWEDVESVEFPNGGYSRIHVRPKESESVSGSGFGSLVPDAIMNHFSDMRLLWFDGHEAYKPMIRAWVKSTGGPEEATSGMTDDDAWYTDRGSVSENVRSILDPDESVLWGSTEKRSSQLRILAFGMGVLGVFVFIVSVLIIGIVYPLYFEPMRLPTAVAVSGLAACVSMAALYRAQERWNKNVEYVVTDRRLISCRGLEPDCAEVGWEEVEELQRRGDDIRVYTRDPTEIEPLTGGYPYGGSSRTKPPALSFTDVPSAKAAYWKLRKARPEEDQTPKRAA